MVQGTKRKKRGRKKKPNNTRKNMENTDEHTHNKTKIRKKKQTKSQETPSRTGEGRGLRWIQRAALPRQKYPDILRIRKISGNHGACAQVPLQCVPGLLPFFGRPGDETSAESAIAPSLRNPVPVRDNTVFTVSAGVRVTPRTRGVFAVLSAWCRFFLFPSFS